MLLCMERVKVASSVLLSAGYDPAARELELEFHGGRVYRYSDVPAGVYEFLLRTKHKGSFVNRKIQGHYAYREVTAEPPEQDLLAALTASIKPRNSPDD